MLIKKTNCFYFSCFYIYWSIIALECFVSFSYTVKWISYMCTYILTPLRLPCTQPHSTPLVITAPCAILHLHTNYFILGSVYVNATLPVWQIIFKTQHFQPEKNRKWGGCMKSLMCLEIDLIFCCCFSQKLFLFFIYFYLLEVNYFTIYYQGWNRSPAQVGCMRHVLRAGALGRPRGMGWRGTGRGDRDGEPMANSCQCMAKTTTIL